VYHVKPRRHACAMSADTFQPTKPGNIHVLYADKLSVSGQCLPARMENSKVYTRTLSISNVSYVYVSKRSVLTFGRTKEFVLLLRICNPVHVYGKYIVQITNTIVKR
jgi:hypothetical protein